MENQKILLDDNTLSWLGYIGKYKDKKKRITILLKKNPHIKFEMIKDKLIVNRKYYILNFNDFYYLLWYIRTKNASNLRGNQKTEVALSYRTQFKITTCQVRSIGLYEIDIGVSWYLMKRQKDCYNDGEKRLRRRYPLMVTVYIWHDATYDVNINIKLKNCIYFKYSKNIITLTTEYCLLHSWDIKMIIDRLIYYKNL
ncbi:hypothetical protein GpSGHVEth029 [Glossina pallidipes salivary gland hypertrophy virus]|uniref:MSV199 domain-containing protein n=1 Tax=Glossina hytrovirus (isolate Glossina pallidipes/Ethiopia/Seibersdorf/-) TaxID=379529 RepID=A0A0Y0GFI1_GHVS|nr:hypothetical protein GpSGHVEth029 [Glossina pallidipes salivary gland hypertrophy virus]